MKNLTNSIKTYNFKLFAYLMLIISIVYLLSDYSEWVLRKDKFVFDLNLMPMYRRMLSNLYIILLGYGGYLLIKGNKKSWDVIIISMTSIIPSFIIIPMIWGVSFYVNWIVDLPLLLWYLFSVVVIITLIIHKQYFTIKKWKSRLAIIILINVLIRILHEVLLHEFAHLN